MSADVENAYAGLEKKGKGKKGKGAAKAADSSQTEDKKLMHSLDMLGAFATLKVYVVYQSCAYLCVACHRLSTAAVGLDL